LEPFVVETSKFPAALDAHGGTMKMNLWIAGAIALSFALGMVAQATLAGRDATPDARVTGLGGIFFKSQDPKKLADWYREHLGIPLATAGASGPAYHVFEWKEKDSGADGQTVFTIFPEKSNYFNPSQAPFMINFRVANLNRLLAQLKQEGVTVDAKVESESNGQFGWVMDPDGNRIELWEPK
jgi:catechol 2,3-dioxygenase-like lactoylglutathione lyase family enzyme